MSYFYQYILRLTKQVYPKEYLVQQAQQAKAYMDTHYAEPITLDDIAAAATVSKYHFIRLFRYMYGRTPNQYLISVRIKHARQLLQQGMPATDACYAVGFTSPPTFTALFRKMTGMTPAAYRNKAILNK